MFYGPYLRNPQLKTQTKNERKVMNDKFDELAKGLAQTVTRRGALKRFGVGFAGAVLFSLGLAQKAEANHGNRRCKPSGECPPHQICLGGFCVRV